MTEAVALTEPEVAVTVAVPFATEVTRPADETVADNVSDDAHVTGASDITDPDASFTVTVKVAVSASEAKLKLVGESVTDAAV